MDAKLPPSACPLVALAVVALVSLVAAGCDSSSKAKSTSSTTAGTTHSAVKASGPVDVLYAASLENLMNTTIGPAFGKASGARFSGFPAGSSELASDIKGKVKVADVFLSASPDANTTLQGAANGDWVSWYSALATAPLVLGYDPNSHFAADIKSKPWYQVIDEPGFRVGRTDPNADPKGKLTVKALQQAETTEHATGLAPVLSSSSNVFPEESLVGDLQSGQLDAGFFYANEAKAANIPTVSLAPVKLSANYTVTVVNRAPHQQAAIAFVAFLYSPAGQAILRNSGLTVASPPVVSGTASDVPIALQPELKS